MFPSARQPASAGMASYWLGGKDHYAEDREAADRVAAAFGGQTPAKMIRAARRWQACAVRRMAGTGVRQFVDLGCGYPVTGTCDDELMPVHEVARDAGAATARVLYCDSDGEAADAAWLMTEQVPGTGAVCADMRDPAAVLGSDAGRRLIDPGKPCGLVFGLSLHYQSPDAARDTVTAWAGAVAPGSLIAVTAGRNTDPESWERVLAAYTAGPLYNFTEAEVRALFGGLDLLPPGVTAVEWGAAGRAESRLSVTGGLAVKR